MGIVEIYVGVAPKPADGIEFVPTYYKLDLFEDESINLNHKLKDSNDIAKVFSTYSQTFSIPATFNNTKTLSYFFDADVVSNTKKNYVDAKIYVNKQLFKKGKINITEGKFEKEVAKSYSITFLTGGATLKELVGDTLVTDIYSKESFDGSYTLKNSSEIGWDRDNVFNLVNSPSFSNFIVPLISNKRVWSYNTGASSDVKWVNSSTNLPKAIDIRELRPAIKYKKVLQDIFSAYNIPIDCPLLNTSKLNNLFIHITGENLYSAPQKLAVSDGWTSYQDDPFLPVVPHQWDVTTSGTDTINIFPTNNATTQVGVFNISFDIQDAYNSSEKLDVEFRIIDQRPGKVGQLITSLRGIELGGNKIYASLHIDKTLYGGITTANPLKFSIEVVTSNVATWDDVDYGLFITNNPRTYLYGKKNFFNGNAFYNTNVQLEKSLPEMKIIDFLSSFFKMFNIYVFQEDNSDVLKLYTVDEFVGDEVEYNLVNDSSTAKTQEAYNRYDFRHKESNYFSNVAFRKAVGREYGQLIYNTGIKENKGIYEVTTDYSIVPQTFIAGTNIVTQYGFDSSNPTDDFVGSGGYGSNGLYTPNTGEMTLFYYNGTDFLKDEGGANITLGFRGNTQTKQLTKYPIVTITNDITTPLTSSIGFQLEINIYPIGFNYNKTLYSEYYSDIVESLVGINKKTYDYECILTPIQILDFSLINTVIIRNRRYKIEEAVVNIVTGKTKLKLINL